jgi:glyceraldehyde-3-phosphate dehydrogenase/erythrose-4-phosphate dehydrogenase
VCDEPLVSMDFRGSFASVTVDTTLTMVVGEDMIKVVAWYDNEWAYRYSHTHFLLFIQLFIYQLLVFDVFPLS